MSITAKTIEQIRRAGIEALVRELGPVGMVRFLQQYDLGRGDYSAEREQWLGQPDVDALAEEARQRREATKGQ